VTVEPDAREGSPGVPVLWPQEGDADGDVMSLPDGLAASLGEELAAGLLLTTGALVAAGAGLVHAATAASRPRARSSRLIMRHLLESGPR
jgi:hypothetical protein